jgi:hypothetical protein
MYTRSGKGIFKKGSFGIGSMPSFGLAHETYDQRPTRPRIGASCEVPRYVGGAGLHGEHVHVSLIWSRRHAEGVLGGFALVCG